MVLTVICTVLGVFNIVVLATTMSVKLLIANVIIFVVMIIYIQIRKKMGKVHMEISYEAD